MTPTAFPFSARLALLTLLSVCVGGCSSWNRIADPMAADIAEADATSRGESGAVFGFGSIYETLIATPAKFISQMTGPEPSESVAKMEDADFPDLRISGIHELVSRPWGKQPPYTERYAQIADDDPDHLVRATAIRAMNRSRYDQEPDVLVRGLEDRHELVRLEAAKALSNAWAPEAAAKLRSLVETTGETREVRLAAADALRHDRTPETFRTLVTLLADRDFGVAWTARRSLRRMTGQDFRYSEADWTGWLGQNPLG
jgi:hypothetical protein